MGRVTEKKKKKKGKLEDFALSRVVENIARLFIFSFLKYDNLQIGFRNV